MLRIILDVPHVALHIALLAAHKPAAAAAARRVVVQLLARLARARVAQARVHGARVCADERRGSAGEGLLVVEVWVGRVRGRLGCGAGGQRLRFELGSRVLC